MPAGVIGAGVCFAVSMLTAAALQLVRGSSSLGDLRACAIWTVLFAAVVGHLGVELARLPRGPAIVVAGAAGAAAGFVNTLCVRWMLGPWFGAFGFPVLYAWLLGGLVGAVVGLRRAQVQRCASAGR